MIHHANDATFDEVVLQHPGAVLVDFYTTTCQPCRHLAAEIQVVAAEMPGIKVVKVDADQSRGLAASFGIRSVPVLVGFRNGQAVARVNGKPPVQRLRGLMQSLL